MISVYADIGGTFTDIVMNINGHESLLKIPTLVSDPSSSLVSGIISLLKAQKIMTKHRRNVKIDFLAHSTTIATNAILGQTGLVLPRVALVTTKGFRDILEIGRQNRSSLYDLQIERPPPIIGRRDRYEVKERIDATGREIDPLSLDDCMNVARKIAARKINHVAISFLHSYKNSNHETKAKRILEDTIPNCVVDCSNEVDPEYREYERTSTTVVNLVLKPIVSEYLGKLAHRASKNLKIERNYIVQSNGGLVWHEEGMLFPAKLIESGPASGLAAAAVFARRLGHGDRILSFDMGGTTAKVGTVIGGMPEETMEFEVGGKSINGRRMKGSGYPVRFPFLDLVEVSAGGGTIAWADKSGRLRVGPISSGADPGPACYDKGSLKPTVTDANLVLGRLPKAIIGGRMRLDLMKARESIRRLNKRLNPCFATVEDAALAIVSLANHEMLRAMRIATMERGLNPTEFMLVCFGGAGPLHGCDLAEGLGISKVAVPLHPGTFSAEGISFSKIRHDFAYTLLTSIDKADFSLARSRILEQAEDFFSKYARRGSRQRRLVWKVETRYSGQSYSIFLQVNDPAKIKVSKLSREFSNLHRRFYGFSQEDAAVEVVSLRLETYESVNFDLKRIKLKVQQHLEVESWKTLMGKESKRLAYLSDGTSCEILVLSWPSMPTGKIFEGPICVEQYDSTLFVPSGWKAVKKKEIGSILLSRSGE